MKGVSTTVRSFYLYQKERFPIIVLGISFLPAILSSGAVVATQVKLSFVTTALVVSLAYLLHVRIIDEFRDYEHDLIHHKERPVSTGTITLKELGAIDWIAILLVAAAALYAGPSAFMIAAAMLLYSYFARNEFFLGLQFRKHFFLYNAFNLLQMFFLQILVYTVASETFTFSLLVSTHFLFTSTGTVIFEFLRKVKSPGQDGTGQDTYTWFLGLNNALVVYAALAILNVLLFIKVILLLQGTMTYWIPITIALITCAFSALLIHALRRDKRTNEFMQGSFMLMYGAFNILLFLAA